MTQDITSILLPASRVDFYALDDGTAATAQMLAADWRFARVGIQVNRAGIEAAIENYGQYASPELIIIETNDISENFIAQLGQLAGVCAAGTDAVIIGPMNDVHLYRSLVGMGVKDYLVRPVAEGDFVSVIAKALVDKRGLSGSRLTAVIGAKGGVGCTTMAQVLAWNIAEGLKQKTMLMDAAGSSGTLGVSYGVEPTTTFTEAVRQGASGSEDDMKRIQQELTEHLFILVCGNDPIMTDSPDPDSVETLVNRLMQKYPDVVVDLSGAAPAVQKRILARAGHVVIVSTPLLPSLRNCRTLLGEIKALRAGLKEVQLVLNMVGMAGSDEVSAADVKTALDMEPSARIAYAPKIFAGSEATGKPAGENKAAADILATLMPIASAASGKEYAGGHSTGGSGKKDSPFGFLKNLGKK